MNKIEQVARAIAEDLNIPISRCMDTAKAAIETMLEPTEEMKQAVNGMGLMNPPYVVAVAYQAMIQAALKE